jgi:hypothetical protein
MPIIEVAVKKAPVSQWAGRMPARENESKKILVHT